MTSVTLRRFLLSCYPAVSLAVAACQSIDPAVYECQTLLETINEVVIEAQTITQSEQVVEGEEPNLDIWLQAADVLNQGSEAIANLQLDSDILQDYQTQVSQIYNQQAQATYSMVEAWQKKDLETAMAAQAQAQAAGQQEKATGESLNNYCQDKEKELQSTS